MMDCIPSYHPSARAATLAALLLALGVGLGGCANLGDSFVSSAFVDPAKYDLYDCKQLETERAGLTARTADLQKLIDKANTGAGGAVVGEMVYRNDYIAIRAQYKLADENFRRGNCVETPPAAAPTPVAAAPAVNKRR